MKHVWYSLQEDKMSSYRINDIEALSEQLRSLKIINRVLEETKKQSDKEMLITPA